MHNPTFKTPLLASRTGPSPSPPRAFVEPLSPPKPRPIEPSFNYPAVNPIEFSVRPEPSLATVPKPRAQSVSHKNGHHRTPSTIDALAEAALAVEPSYQSHTRKSSDTCDQRSWTYSSTGDSTRNPSEPPHKRAKSVLLASPHVGAHASRPATSYEHTNGWPQNRHAQPAHTYDSRVEEAALLLNFRTGGWPSNGTQMSALTPPNAARPHANSFPRTAHESRSIDGAPHSTLLSPFKPQDGTPSRSALPSPQQTIADARPSPVVHDRMRKSVDVIMADTPVPLALGGTTLIDKVTAQQTLTPPEETDARAKNSEVSVTNASEPPKARRGWPKGKPRGSGARKTMAEKAATKRAATTRKKTPDTAKSGKPAKRNGAESVGKCTQDSKVSLRRKSLSDLDTTESAVLESVSSRATSVPRDVPLVIHEVSSSKGFLRQGKATAETVCARCSTARQSATSHGELDEWISCNGCKNWFHIDCAGFKKAHEIRDVDKYFCSTCEPAHGKTTYVRKSTRAHASVDYAELQRGVLKTSEESVEHHYIQPIKDGTFQFDPETFPRMRPEMITRDFFEKSNTFIEPICIPAAWNPRPWDRPEMKSEMDVSVAARPVSGHGEDPMADLLPDDFEYDAKPDDGQDRLDMVMPEGLTVREVCNLVGPDTPLDVIDVKTQNSGAKWNLSRWADYYEEEGEEKAIRNVISLEVSQTKLGRLLRRPKVVRDIDLQDSVWPQEEIDRGRYPKVQFYCLMSVADSYTDFHIDFGGSSVYYHIMKGKKTFFFIPPKPKHLKAYEEWNESPQQNYTFLPSITRECYRVDLSEGDTMLIPSGWIHAVWTPATSLVIGGNFLTRMAFKNQFKVVEIEKNNETPMKFRYPFFQKIMWYTALQYLEHDPLPSAVSQLFYEGRRFERQMPIWQDFDGDIAERDDQPGAKNERYYSQAEVDGLPDLVNFIFRTVMVVMGRVEGVTADRMKRVNASIPKGHGEPLEIAKTFALWVAWKRGNEDPPAWAHPDAVLPNSKEEGPPKKLSARALKEMERKEAIAAWRIAPDRQSARVLTKTSVAANGTLPSETPPPPPSQPWTPTQLHQNEPVGPAHPSPIAPSPAAMVVKMPGHYMSTPKTSVLGPKRVACDACRKRRIRCKHKDLVLQATPDGADHPEGIPLDPSFSSRLAQELHDNITVTPPNPGVHVNFSLSDDVAAQPHDLFMSGRLDGDLRQLSDRELLPGTNAYVNAAIPMALNGVPIFGDVPKRGRSKACYECRKSKRRCVHDESGNVDPVKAAETPVPRGSVASKKPQSSDDGSPLQIRKQEYNSASQPSGHHHFPATPIATTNGVREGPSFRPDMSSSHTHQTPHIRVSDEQHQPPIDPNLLETYPIGADGREREQYVNNNYPFPTTESSPQFVLQSLEQIANEVLDMNDHHHEEPFDSDINGVTPKVKPQQDGNEHGTHGDVQPPHLPAKLDGSVDSAVSMPAVEGLPKQEREPDSDDLRQATPGHAVTSPGTDTVQRSIESHRQANGDGEGTLPREEPRTSPATNQSSVNGLPLYQPPAPLSQSPELPKRHAPVPNGWSHSSSLADVPSQKRKRPPSWTTPAPKKTKLHGADPASTKEPSVQETADERLARMLQQEDLGLRHRSK